MAPDNGSGAASSKSGERKRNSQYTYRGKGGRGRGGGKNKKRDMGRNEWSKQKGDKRAANAEAQEAKRRKISDDPNSKLPVYATKFADEDIAAEERRPKKKVAVTIGYSGTGYKGMQLAPDQKTIEGDLFKAFVAAGAISKANADDPKKSSFVRCARTDKGVHAAGNVISLKLIVEDEDIVKKINDALTPQIRIWGFERTNNSFSAYQLCDSRVYEYLIPTHSFLPPHPRSYLGRKCAEWADKKGPEEVTAWKERQSEVDGFWEKVDEEMIKPILEKYDQDIRDILEKALWLQAEREASKNGDGEGGQPTAQKDNDDPEAEEQSNAQDPDTTTAKAPLTPEERAARIQRHKTINEAIKLLRQTYISAKRTYRIPPTRLQRLQTTLNLYLGTKNFWNYTILKNHSDPSAKRVIKSFNVNTTPILINGTEWLSLKVHGQSFMMHQIRKMVGMASLIIRCGADPSTLIPLSYTPANISIPKAPSLGLLLERPVFDSYNRRAKSELGREEINFDKYKDEMDAFKQKFIYERMYEDEERENVFGNFFNHVDNFPGGTFLWCTSGGVEASGEGDGKDAEEQKKGDAGFDSDSDDDGVAPVKDNAGDEG